MGKRRLGAAAGLAETSGIRRLQRVSAIAIKGAKPGRPRARAALDQATHGELRWGRGRSGSSLVWAAAANGKATPPKHGAMPKPQTSQAGCSGRPHGKEHDSVPLGLPFRHPIVDVLDPACLCIPWTAP